jgi:hypothetical protein
LFTVEAIIPAGGESMRKTALCCVAAVLAAGVLRAQQATPGPAITGADELVQKKGAYAATWVRPDADITRYTKLAVWEPEFSFREGGKTSVGTTSAMLSGDSGPFAIRDEDRERFKKLVSDTFVAELASSKVFEVVGEVGPGTLIVRAGFLDITSNVPPNASRYNIHLASVGEASIVFELIDANTGVIQARAGERRQIQPEMRMRGVNVAPTNSATVWTEVERFAREQARTLREALEKAKQKAAK